VYPDYVPTPLAKKPHEYWKDKQNQKEFFDQLAIKWNIQTPNDWNKVTQKMLYKEGGHFIRKYYNNSPQRGTDLCNEVLTWNSIASTLS
jgi:hypothetical protein